MTVRIAICEDNAEDCARLVKLLDRFMRQQQLQAQVRTFENGDALLAACEGESFHIVFMDIYLGKKDGIETARRLRQKGDDCIFILTTTSTEHGLAGFEIGATHYLGKPLEYEALCEALYRCQHLLQAHARYIEVLENRVAVRLLLRDILYIEATKNNCVIHTEKRQHKVYIPLHSLLQQLQCPPFLHCHRSFVANLAWVQGFDGANLTLRGGAQLPVGRAYRAAVRSAYNAHLADVVNHATP